MVVVKQYSTAQIDSLNNLTGRVLYDATLNALKFNNSETYDNILLHKDRSNNVTQINNINTTGNLGINTTSPSKQVEINSSTGDCLRLTYNDNNGSAINYTDFTISNSGNLILTPSGGDTTLNSTLTISGITTFSDTTASTSNVLGSLKLAGGIGISNTTDALSSTNGGSFTTAGGMAVAKSLFVGQNLSIGGDLTVLGTTTTVNSTIIQLEDNTLKLNSGPTGSGYDAGIINDRFQTSNDLGNGDVVSDTVKENYALDSVSNNTITLPNTASSSNDYYNNWWIKITSGSGQDQVRQITDYDGTTKVAILDSNFTTNPSSSDNVNLYNKTLSTFLWQENNNRFIMAFSAKDAPAGQLQILDYADFACNKINIVNNDASTSNNTGSLITAGGIGITNTTDAISASNGGTLTTAGGAAIAKKLFVGTDLDVGNSVNITNDLTVGDDVTITGDLSVLGTFNLNGTVDLSGATTIYDTLSVTGAIDFSSTIDATSSTDGGCLTVSGGTAIAKKLFVGTDLSIGGNSTLTGTLGVTGNTTLTGTLDVTNVINFNNTTDATSSTDGGCLTVDGGAAIAKKLYVGDDLNITDALSVGGNSSLTGTLTVTGNSTLSGTLGVTGATTLSDTLGVTGNTTLSGTLDVTSTINFNDTTDATSSTAGGSLTIDGGAAVAKKLYVGDDLNVTDDLSIGGDSSLTGTLGVTGATTLSSTLDVSSSVNFNDTTDATSSTSGGCLTIDGGVAIAKKLYVGDDLNVTDDVSIGGDLTVTGPILAIPTGNTAGRPNPASGGYIRYNSETSQFEGYGAGNSWGSLGGVSDVNQNTKILAEDGAGTDDDNLRFFNAGNETMRLTSTSSLGLGTTAPDKKLEINSTSGDCLRLTYNDSNGSATNYVDFLVSSGGNLSITPSGNDVDITTHNGSSVGLKLGGTLITSTATELNYVDTTPGTAEASKALVLNANRDISNINELSTKILNATIDNATTNNVAYPINITRNTSGSPAAGLGAGIEFYIENSANANVAYGSLEIVADDVTDDSENGKFVVNLMTDGSSSNALTLTKTALTVEELVETSDARVKENIKPADLEESYNKVMRLNLVDYNFITDSNKRVHRGLIAQELKEIIPNAVHIDEKEDISDFHSVSTKELVGFMIGAIQHMNNKYNDLEKKYNDLEKKYNDLL